MIEKNLPVVSVCMITYNHEQFIHKAIEGVLSQKCSFKIELNISNDCSKDNTHNIITSIISQYSNNENISINYYNNTVNLGMMDNFIFNLNNCSGKYIAICEGDDYWIDPLKLESQVNFLDRNDDYNICGTDIKVKSRGIFKDRENSRLIDETLTIRDVLHKNPFATCSVLFRNRIPEKEYFKDFHTGDWPLYSYLIKDSKGINLKNKTAVYNFHGGGVASSLNLSDYLKNRLNDRLLLAQRFPKKYIWTIKKHGYRLIINYFKNMVLGRTKYNQAVLDNKQLIFKFLFN